jgi:hypothetical protein
MAKSRSVALVRHGLQPGADATQPEGNFCLPLTASRDTC